MWDMEKGRITGNKEKIANALAQTMMVLLKTTLGQFKDSGERACLLAGSAIPSLSGLAVLFGNHKEETINPSPDDITFGACYMIACVEQCGEALGAGFTPGTVDQARVIFQHITGRDYPINPTLLEVIQADNNKAKKNTPEPLQKFLPN